VADILPICGIGTAYTTARVNLRTQPNSGSEILTVMPQALRLDVWGRVGHWLIVQQADGLTGYAHESYLEGVANL
jgi:hypothetical protein